MGCFVPRSVQGYFRSFGALVSKCPVSLKHLAVKRRRLKFGACSTYMGWHFGSSSTLTWYQGTSGQGPLAPGVFIFQNIQFLKCLRFVFIFLNIDLMGAKISKGFFCHNFHPVSTKLYDKYCSHEGFI